MEIESLFSVKGKVVLITGGGSGIGAMFSEAFVRNGARVYVSSRKKDACQELAEKLNKVGPGKCIALDGVDLSRVKDCELLAQQLKQANESKLHVLVNNSGTTWGEPFDVYRESGFDKVLDLNLKGLFYTTKALFPFLKNAASASDPARVINIGSIAGLRPSGIPDYAYSASKAAVHSLTQTLAMDFAEHHITVNAVAPGIVPSKMSQQLLTYAPKEELEARIPLQRVGAPTDMAGVILFLSSAASAWLTGAIIPVDGGAVLRTKL